MSDLPPAEGSAEKPFVENPYTALLKEVHWGGGGFTVGVNVGVTAPAGDTTDAVFLYGTKSWTAAKAISGARSLYDNRAGAYGNPPRPDDKGNPVNTPTFLLGGGATVFGVGPAGFLYLAWIETSTDAGKTWVRSYDANQSFVVAMVYDKTNHVFYAQAAANATGGSDYTWQVLKSADGLSWVVVETVAGGPANNNYASPIMTAAADPIYQDAAHNNCPGGIYGYDPVKKILMAPYPDIAAYAYEARFSASQIQIRKEDEHGNKTFTYKYIGGMDRVFSLAYSGGVWQAAGSGDTALIATSTDDGDTWTTTYSTGPNSFAKIMLAGASGAPLTRPSL